jgi:hypothetical protein
MAIARPAAVVPGSAFAVIVNLPAVGAVDPMPTLPPVTIRIRSVWDAVLKAIKSVVPAPEVLWSVRVDAAAVPPLYSGVVRLVEPDIVVNAPVVAVVAPTVPLMLIEAVPVRLVTVPLDGVPRAPPLTTNAPAVPVLTPRAVTTPVPVVVVAGATPAPPPTTRELAARAAEVAHVVPDEK